MLIQMLDAVYRGQKILKTAQTPKFGNGNCLWTLCDNLTNFSGESTENFVKNDEPHFGPFCPFLGPFWGVQQNPVLAILHKSFDNRQNLEDGFRSF